MFRYVPCLQLIVFDNIAIYLLAMLVRETYTTYSDATFN